MKKLLFFAVFTAVLISLPACSQKPAITDDGSTKTFVVEVVPQNGDSARIDVTTAKATLGDALLEKGIIEGEQHPQFGLMVKKVNGILADWDTNGTYWALYIGGDYAMTGVDSTPVEDGAVYTFKQ
jgi:hypothetical protein